MIYVNDYSMRRRATPAEMDRCWAQGWRHFGTYFFRYSTAEHDGAPHTVLPLRIDLTKFAPSRSQKRTTARNRDLRVDFRDTFVDEVKEALFHRHKQRYQHNVPESIYNFLSPRPAHEPCRNREIAVYAGERLIAVSFLDLGAEAVSAVYAMFEPDEARRSLGIFTILAGIDRARALNCRYYYPGYAYREPSFYDYKKNFAGLEYLDWETGWRPYLA